MRDRTNRLKILAAVSITVMACADPDNDEVCSVPELPPGAEAISLGGDTLVPPTLTGETFETRTRELIAADSAWRAHPEDADSIIWFGRRLAYMGRYRDAVGTFTEGIQKHPDDARMYRHRGHRFITVRMFGCAIDDLSHAADLAAASPDEVEPDGLPNAAGIPLSTLRFNTWYHLGLAHYLRGEYQQAERAYRRGLEASVNPDLQVATRYWLFLTLERLGRTDEARTILADVSPEMEIIENDSYHQLLLLFKGALPVDSVLAAGADDALQNATVGYGIARWYAQQGQPAQAQATLERVLAGSQWAAFGYIAAEADVAR